MITGKLSTHDCNCNDGRKDLRVENGTLIACIKDASGPGLKQLVKRWNCHTDLLEVCKLSRKWFEDFIECKPRPTEQSAIDMQSALHEAIVSVY